ncbi:MAG: TetR/AcrR family transcriptional regulator [Pseudochelatococcus sp.]|uniref:TetR/AcrR family transcriptional regulator n=1 Tax=Pseudochelatococcus sp. TaxID=2020869 RepID=UPI003D944CBF
MPAVPKRRRPSLKQRIEIAAYAMFEEMGIGHVTVDAIAEAAETNKAGVYRQFGSKDALVEAWIVDTIVRYRSMLDDLEYSFPDDPVAQLRGFAENIAANLPAISDRGCPFVNTIAEIGDSTNPLIKRIMAHKAKQAEHLAKLCERAGIPGPAVAAAHITFVLEGAQITAQNGSVENIADHTLSIIETILETATTEKPR